MNPEMTTRAEAPALELDGRALSGAQGLTAPGPNERRRCGDTVESWAAQITLARTRLAVGDVARRQHHASAIR